MRSVFLCGVLAMLFLSQMSPALARDPAVVSKSTVGDQTTQQYSTKLATVKKPVKVDPYTGTTDKKNYLGKAAIAKNQTVLKGKKKRHTTHKTVTTHKPNSTTKTTTTTTTH